MYSIFFAIHTVFVFAFAHISVVIRRSPDVCLQIMLTAFASGYMMMRHRFPFMEREMVLTGGPAAVDDVWGITPPPPRRVGEK